MANIGLKKDLGLFSAILYGVAVILGAGIYVIIGEGTALAGNSIWLSFLIAALIAGFTGLSYCELSSMFPKEAADYVYTKKAFNSELISFIVSWILIMGLVVSAATVSLGFASYFSSLFNVPVLLIAWTLIIILSIVNYTGIKQSSRLNIVLAAVEILGLVIVIALGMTQFGKADLMSTPSGPISAQTLPGILSAAALIFFAYLGFENIVTVSEETKNSTKTIPRALIIALIICSILYVLVSIAAVNLADWKVLSQSKAPLAAAVSTLLGPVGVAFLSFAALASTATTVLILLIACSRFISGIARERTCFPNFLSWIHPQRGTPAIAIVLIMAFTVIAASLNDIGTVARITNIGVFIVFAFVNLSLIVLRFKHPHTNRPFKSPLNIGKLPVLALLGLLSSLYMISVTNVAEILYVVAVIAVGFLIYPILVRKKMY